VLGWWYGCKVTVVTMEANEGSNFRIVQGQKAKSRVVVSDNFCYLIEKNDKNHPQGPVVYLKCQVTSCPGRAMIKNGVLAVSPNLKKRHHCNQDSPQNLHKISVNEIIAKMKERAATESSSYYVSKVKVFGNY